MIGGHMKSSFIALIAAAGLVGGITSAQAADLGGDCCADLEERVAELEATTARKGNRKVSLTISGQVNESVMYWDNGVESNVYQLTNDVSRSRFRFLGSAKINADVSAGYLIEIGVRTSSSHAVNAGADDAGNGLDIRHSAWWLQSKQLGKLWVGQTSAATDAITEINLANAGHFATQNSSSYIGGFAEPITGLALTRFMGGAGITGGTSGQIGEGERQNVVKYESPVFAGFAVSVAAGEDDMWDVALRYAGEFSGFKIAAGVGYMNFTDDGAFGCVTVGGSADCSQIGASGAIMHVPTGLFVHGAYGQRSDDNVAAGQDDTSTQWYIQAGIEQNFFGLGKTTLFGEYQNWDVGFTAGNNVNNRSLEMTMWGIGFNQAIDAAAMDLYIRYNQYDPDSNQHVGEEKFQVITAGGRIQF